VLQGVPPHTSLASLQLWPGAQGLPEWIQVPLLQVSVPLQYRPSLQGVPLGSLLSRQVPLPLQESGFVQSVLAWLPQAEPAAQRQLSVDSVQQLLHCGSPLQGLP